MKNSQKIIAIGTAAALLIGLSIFVPLQFISWREMHTNYMIPTLEAGDLVIIDKFSQTTGVPIKRADIVAFYPPPIYMGEGETQYDWSEVLKIPISFGNCPPVFVKRIIGLPGETVRIEKGDGVYINGVRLNEDAYIKNRAQSSLSTLGDIGGTNMKGEQIAPYFKLNMDAKIVVPEKQYFVLQDNRKYSSDSCIFGFVDSKQILGRIVTAVKPNGQFVQIVK